MKFFTYISFLFLSLNGFGQIDYSKLLIGRTEGTKVLHDANTTRIFGFAETLSESIDIPGPTIEIIEGDSIMLDFWNMSQGAPHTIHLHGLDVNQANDGVPSLSFEVHHMDHGYYYFKAPTAGTYIYHCHVVSTIHVQAGMYGVIIVRPPNGDAYVTWNGGENYNREFLWTATEVDTNWHVDSILDHPYDTINPMPVSVPELYKPQYFMVNGMSGTQLTNPLNYYTAAENDKVYMRLVNIGYYGVRYIFPNAISARTLSSDGRPFATEVNSDTIEVLPGERYGTMIQLGSDPLYPVTVEHFNLNTQLIESNQIMTIRTSAANLDEEALNGLKIYPNPSKTGIFQSSKTFEENYQVYDMLGELILDSMNQKIDLSFAQDGMYILMYKGTPVRLIK